MLFALVILPCILGDDLAFIGVPDSCTSARHQASFPCAIVFHCGSSIYSMALLVAVAELSLVLGTVLELYFALPVDEIVAEVTFIGELFIDIRNQLAFTLLFPLFEMALVNSFILVLGINSISINHVIFPFTLVNVPVVKNCKPMAFFYLKLIESTLIAQSGVKFVLVLLVF